MTRPYRSVMTDDEWSLFTLLVLVVDVLVIGIALWQMGGTDRLVGFPA